MLDILCRGGRRRRLYIGRPFRRIRFMALLGAHQAGAAAMSWGNSFGRNVCGRQERIEAPEKRSGVVTASRWRRAGESLSISPDGSGDGAGQWGISIQDGGAAIQFRDCQSTEDGGGGADRKYARLKYCHY